MNKRVAVLVLACLVLLFSALGAVASSPRDLSFDERVQAQVAIEQVYHSHRTETTESFEVAVPRRVLEEKVRRYLKQSAALDSFWGTPITAEMLSRETRRIMRDSRMPERLHELFGALGHDPFLIAECISRPILVDRLTRNYFAYDERIHKSARAEAEAGRAKLQHGRADTFKDHASATVVDFVAEDVDLAPEEAVALSSSHSEDGDRRPTMKLARKDLDAMRSELGIGEVGPLVERRDSISWRVLMDDDGERLQVATFSVPKTSWDSWWRDTGASFDEASVRAVPVVDLPVDPRGSIGGAVSQQYQEDVPDLRYGHTAVWTGSEMIVWGGHDDRHHDLNTGGKYDPLTDTWTPTSLTDAPTTRYGHTAVWSGDAMIVWGGDSGSNEGGLYYPAGDTWVATSTVDAPDWRSDHSAVWAEGRMLVWGGIQSSTFLDTGGIYDARRDTWKPMSTVNAPAARREHTAVRVDYGMVVWGGKDDDYLNTGGRYNVSGDTWEPTSTVNAPSPRNDHTAVWTQSTTNEMVVWGGRGATGMVKTGGRYSLRTGIWSETSETGTGNVRSKHTAVWADEMDAMVIWGGRGATFDAKRTGRIYDPVADTWSPTTTLNAPSKRYAHTAVWTGEEMIVWGGRRDEDHMYGLNTGGRWRKSDKWVPTSTGDIPDRRVYHTAVWTGAEMIVWGGVHNDPFEYLRSGGVYDPVTDNWRSTTLEGSPQRREDHTAVWTGSEMVVWGGRGSSYPYYPPDGGRYDPVTDAWEPMTYVDAPEPRTDHTAVWIGGKMVVWGGTGASFLPEVGGRYSPDTDTWTAMSTTNAPDLRFFHTAVAAGAEMIVYGGVVYGNPSNTGGRYNVYTDTWTPTSTVNAPIRAFSHSAVWTGSKMIVFGGIVAPPAVETNMGGVYNRSSDTWTATSMVDAPSPRELHSAVWADDEMIIWGGTAPNDGGRYDVWTDTWTAVETTGAPVARTAHTAIWTGTDMVVWGGANASVTYDDGGRYNPEFDCWRPGCPEGDCPLTSPCLAAANCLPWLILGDTDTGMESCATDAGEVVSCDPGETVHVRSVVCNQAPCCSTIPACVCPNDCGTGSELVCK